MTIIYNHKGWPFDPVKARSAVSAYHAIETGNDLNGDPIADDGIGGKRSGLSRAKEKMILESPLVKIEDGVVTFNPAITV